MKRLFALFALFWFAAFCLPASLSASAAPRIIHVVVSLCDNIHQGIVPVPMTLGNGKDPANNLYWGAMYGVKTFIGKQSAWKRVALSDSPSAPVLERIIFKHAHSDTYLIADAYDGAAIRQATERFLDYAAGQEKETITIGKQSLAVGGNAGLVVYMGHNGLMDFSLKRWPTPADEARRDAVVFGCQSQRYFTRPLKHAGARPLLLTSGNMAPEAYILHALADSWARREAPASIHDTVARAYHQYQKSGLKGARRLFVSGE